MIRQIVKVIKVDQSAYNQAEQDAWRLTNARLVVGLIRSLGIKDIVLKMLRGY